MVKQSTRNDKVVTLRFDGILENIDAADFKTRRSQLSDVGDIDVAGDLTRLAEELRLAPARAPRTAAWLKEWGRLCGAGTPARST